MFEELRKPGGKLKLAVPRGALLEEVLDLLDSIGIETAEVRGDSRSLVFDGGELITDAKGRMTRHPSFQTKFQALTEMQRLAAWILGYRWDSVLAD